jgi:GNAT superfamily N-acetyltransferase
MRWRPAELGHLPPGRYKVTDGRPAQQLPFVLSAVIRQGLAVISTAVADDLTQRFGVGHWSSARSEKGVVFAMNRGQVFVARTEVRIVATLTLQRIKPWAIEKRYFTAVKAPIYLTAMSMALGLQRRGLGRLAMAEAKRLARAAGGHATRLDAYHAPAGAGGFCAGCGYAERGRDVYRGTPLIYYKRLV